MPLPAGSACPTHDTPANSTLLCPQGDEGETLFSVTSCYTFLCDFVIPQFTP